MLLTEEEIAYLIDTAQGRRDLVNKTIAAYEAKLREQEPFAWACWLNNDTEQKPVDCRISTLEPTAYPIRKKLYIHPAPIPEGWQPIETAPKDGSRVLIKGDCTALAAWKALQ